MSYKIVHTLNIPGKDLGEDLLESMDVTLVKGLWGTEEELIEHCRDADAIVGDIARKPFNRKVIESFEKCRIIAGAVLGYDSIDIAAASEKDIAVTNVPDYCLDEVSGRAVALMLALAYKIVTIDKAIKEKQLNMVGNMNEMLQLIQPVFRMRGQTLGLIGCSKIGTAMALKAIGLGMKVIAYDPGIFDGALSSIGIEPASMDAVLTRSDFISLHIPFMPSTKGLIGYEQFKKMKKTAYIINTARGGVIDEEAMIRALQEGLIAGAGLDVTVKEPIEKDNPLLLMDNVVMSGHSGWYSTEAEYELFRKPTAQVVMALEGRWPLYGLNPYIKERWLKKWN